MTSSALSTGTSAVDVSAADILEQGYRRPAPRGGHSIRRGGRDVSQGHAKCHQGAERSRDCWLRKSPPPPPTIYMYR